MHSPQPVPATRSLTLPGTALHSGLFHMRACWLLISSRQSPDAASVASQLTQRGAGPGARAEPHIFGAHMLSRTPFCSAQAGPIQESSPWRERTLGKIAVRTAAGKSLPNAVHGPLSGDFSGDLHGCALSPARGHSAKIRS